MQDDNPIYTLEEIIQKLEKVRKEGSGDINFPNALLRLAYDVQMLNIAVTAFIKEDKNE